APGPSPVEHELPDDTAVASRPPSRQPPRSDGSARAAGPRSICPDSWRRRHQRRPVTDAASRPPPQPMTASELRERARATLARERGAIVKPHGDRLRIALAFPNTYFVGMSNLGLQTVYRLFNEQDDVVCERVFLPPKQELHAQLASGTRLVTIESQTPVFDFDVFAFSVSFEIGRASCRERAS